MFVVCWLLVVGCCLLSLSFVVDVPLCRCCLLMLFVSVVGSYCDMDLSFVVVCCFCLLVVSCCCVLVVVFRAQCPLFVVM